MASKKKALDIKEPHSASSESTSETIAAASFGLEAMVNDRTRYSTILAFSGVEYVRYEYRPVPDGFEEQAARHPYLTVRQRSSKKVVAEMVMPVPIADPDALEVLPIGGAPDIQSVTHETEPLPSDTDSETSDE